MALHQSALKVCNEALSTLRQDRELTYAQLEGTEESAAGRKCRALYESSRLEVLQGHDWNFVRRRVPLACRFDHRMGLHVAGLPGDVMRVVAVFGPDGRKLEGWETGPDGEVYSREPIASVVYVDDAKDVDRWPPLVRQALVLCLARNLAIPITGRNNDLSVCDNLYGRALKQAVLSDARENKPGPEVWGRNVYADAIGGDRPRAWRGGCCAGGWRC